jgi:hypothetical protein
VTGADQSGVQRDDPQRLSAAAAAAAARAANADAAVSYRVHGLAAVEHHLYARV